MQENTPEVIVTDPDSSEVLRLQFFGDNREDAQAVNQTLQEERFLNCMESKSEGDSTVNQDGGETISSRLQRSLSDRTSPGADHTSKFNDTMRLRLRTGRRDTRDTFTEDRRKLPEKRVLSPGRPRPKEPPPPPPPPPVLDEPSSQVAREHFSSDSSYHHKSSEKTLINSFSEDYQPPPPPPPPRQIFPFTKEEIEKIRNKSCTLRPRSSSNSPVRQSSDSTSIMERVYPRRTSLTFPITNSSKEDGEITMWHRESSVVNNDFTQLMPLEENVPATEAFSCVTEVYEALQKNSKEIEEIGGRIIINNREGSVEKSVKLVVPSDESHSAIPLEQEVNEKSRTIVTVSSPTQKLSVTSPKPQPQTKTSIMIVGKENEVNKGFNKTSLVIGEYKSPIKESGSNKVTINVGGCDYQNVKNKTAKNNTQIEIRNEFKSNITIGPNDNKSRTLLILKPSAINTTADNITKENQTVVNPELTTEKTIDTAAQEEMNELIRNKIDPVEAVRKNIVPHVCGKVVLEEIKGKRVTCTSDEVRKLTNTGNKFVDKKDTSTEEITNHADITTKTGNIADIKSPIFDSQELTETEERLEDDVFSIKDETEENSDCYVCAKNLRKSLSCKPEDEEVRLGLEFDSDENHYETIKDPIYEEISDTPPPLPLSPPPTSVDIDSSIPTRSIFEGASKYDILNYLETAKERGIVVESEDDSEIRSPEHSRISSLDLSSRISQLSNASDSSEESCNLIISPTDSASITSDKVRKSSVEIERNDSGVGSETSKCSRSRWQHLPASQQHSCEDCDQAVETQVTDSGLMFAPLVCRKCAKRRAERREIITEIVETEEKYGRDLKIILDEFYRPMLVAGLLTPEQLSAIFLNVEELLENNATLAEKLRDALEIAIDQGDEDFLTVNIGTIFLDAVPMLHAFESYCTRQGAASLLLANLEKEKELLRIFLRVSQMENSVLRRMNLNSFLMVPVQRVTKYPLLLARLYRVTPTHLKSREALRVAQTKIELHLEHINSLAKDISTTKLWRRISIINGRRTSSEIDMINIKLRKVAVDVLEWNHDEVRFAMEGKLLFTQPTDNNWRRGRTIKLSPINAMLVTLGKPTEDYQPDSDELLAFPRKNGIRDATLLLLKEKSGRYGLLREPLFLDRCIICCEADIEDYFEVQELATKDTYLFKAEDGDQTKRWFRQLQYHAQGLGAWRKRRNALANIMINGMQLRT